MDVAGKVLAAVGLASASVLLYGGLIETRKLVGTRHHLKLPSWPESHRGFRVGILSDTHLSHYHHLELAKKAVEWLVQEDPDVIIHLGDIQNYHRPDLDHWILKMFEPLAHWGGESLAILGNHDYFGGSPDRLVELLAGTNVKVLRNERYRSKGVQWVGVDSACVGRSDPYSPLLETDGDGPIVVLWHEPDMVDHLPHGPELMLSGHSHGGQFVLPGGWVPMTSRLGAKYLSGLTLTTPVPLFVTRGVGITGPPARLCCPAEACVLTLD